MDSDFQQQQHQHHFQVLQRQFQHQKQQTNSLTRFRSAPSSYFASFLDTAADDINTTAAAAAAAGGGNSGGGGGNSGGGGERKDFSNIRPLSPETENIFARFMSSMDGENNSSSTQKLYNIPENPAAQQEYRVEVKQEMETMQQQQQQGNYNITSRQMIYQSHPKPPLASQKSSAAESSFMAAAAAAAAAGAATSSIGMVDSMTQMKKNNNNNPSLTRHSSSPAGFFADILDIDNGYGAMKGLENYGSGGGQMNFSSRQASSGSGIITQDSDAVGKRFGDNTNSGNNDDNYITGYSMSSWDDSILSENFSSLDDSRRTLSEINPSENQAGEGRNRLPLLSHHLSLPKTAAEMLAMEKLMQFQDSVPCRIRAKRGCATHPRSIAERVRRTKISERMRKLQDLVPNMDKQTNTADMLDLAVEYIKDLQKHVKTLSDNRGKCTCSR